MVPGESASTNLSVLLLPGATVGNANRKNKGGMLYLKFEVCVFVYIFFWYVSDDNVGVAVCQMSARIISMKARFHSFYCFPPFFLCQSHLSVTGFVEPARKTGGSAVPNCCLQNLKFSSGV